MNGSFWVSQAVANQMKDQEPIDGGEGMYSRDKQYQRHYGRRGAVSLLSHKSGDQELDGERGDRAGTIWHTGELDHAG